MSTLTIPAKGQMTLPQTLEAGEDFADGAVAYEGEWLGAEEFASFDKKAVTLLKARGKRARLLG